MAIGQDPQVQEASEAIRQILKDANVSVTDLTKPLDLKKTDPLVLRSVWLFVKDDLEKAIQKSLKLKVKPIISLGLHKPKDSVGDANLPVYEIKTDSRDKVLAAFSSALGLEKNRVYGRVLEYVPATSTVTIVSTSNVKPQYLVGGELDTTKVRAAIVDLFTDKSSPIGKYDLVAKAVVLDEHKGTFQITTIPVRIDTGLTSDYASFWRAHVRFEMVAEKVWDMTARIDIGSIPRSSLKDLSKINFRDPTRNTDEDSTFRQSKVSLFTSKTTKNDSTSVLVAQMVGERNPPDTLTRSNEVTRYGDLADLIFSECKSAIMIKK
jgi:hypothetical protein